MNYRATRLLRLPERTVQRGELVEGAEVPPHKLGSYVRLGMLVKQERKKRSPRVKVEDATAPEEEPSEEDET